MRETLEKLMHRWGTDMTVVGLQGETPVRGFFQAVNTKSWQSMESTLSPMGAVSRGQYVFLAPIGPVIQEGDTLRLGGRSYVFRRIEVYYFENQPVYQWGLCVEKGVNDTWGIRSLS